MSADPVALIAIILSAGVLVFSRLDTVQKMRREAQNDTMALLKTQVDVQQKQIEDLQARVARCESAREGLVAENLRLMRQVLGPAGFREDPT
jgi:hypothetical protein